MTADREGEDHHPGREVPDLAHHHPPGLLGVVEMGVGQPRVAPLGYAEYSGRPLRLLRPEARTAPGPGLARGEIEDAGAVARIHGLEQDAGAGQSDVVAVRGDGKNVDGHGGER
jgi:hypothetical protein